MREIVVISNRRIGSIIVLVQSSGSIYILSLVFHIIYVSIYIFLFIYFIYISETALK